MDSMQHENIAVWLDCDPGHDDAIAIMIAAFHPGVELLGISCVHGNVPVEKTTENACKILQACNYQKLGIVYSGASEPLTRPARHDEEIHGETGLNGSSLLPDAHLSLERYKNKSPQPAAVSMAQIILAYTGDKPVWIVATGCHTNLALALKLYPQIKSKIHGISFMGGCLGVGNRSAVAEFNILVDPEASKILIDSNKHNNMHTNMQIIMIPLELTHTVICTSAVLSKLRQSMKSPKFAQLITELLHFFKDTYEKVFHFTEGPPIHDPCAIMYPLYPQIFENVIDYHVQVDTASHLSVGQTVVDVWNYSKNVKNVKVCHQIDVKKFWSVVANILQIADSNTHQRQCLRTQI